MAKGLHRYSVQEAQNAALGQAGSVLIDDTAQHTGPFVAITAITDATIDASDCTSIADTMVDGGATTMTTDMIIPKGVTIYGNFAVFSLATGSVIAYLGAS